MADSTATRVRDHRAHSPFWWWKVHGLPYYFFQRINPTSSAYGAAAWTLGTGYTAKLALNTPDGQLAQKLPDLVGGIASAERITLRVNDFELFDAAGAYRFFGRLRSPARAFQSAAAVKWGRIETDIDPALAAGDTIYLRGPQGFAASGYLYGGGETIPYSAKSNNTPSAGITQFTMSGRNAFPAIDNFGGRTWPVQPWYIAPKDETGHVQASSTVIMADQPFTLIGRRCALFMGYIDGDGKPCAESDGLLRMAGRIQSLTRRGGAYEFAIENVISELSTAKLAPTLARATIAPSQLVVPSAPLRYRSFVYGFMGQLSSEGIITGISRIIASERVITIPAKTYETGDHVVYKGPATAPGGICEAINKAFAEDIAAGPAGAKKSYVNCRMEIINNEPRIVFVYRPVADGIHHLYIRNGVKQGAATFEDGLWNDSRGSLLQALGFSEGTHLFESGDPVDAGVTLGDTKAQVIVGDRIPPSIFIPTVGIGLTGDVQLTGTDAPGSRFFTDQGDGSGTAYVRFGDGQIVRIVDAVSGRISTRERLDAGMFGAIIAVGAGSGIFGGSLDTGYGYYSVPMGAEGTVEQIVIARGPGLPQESGAQMLGEFLASDGGATAVPGALNIYPRGVGLGWEGILDTDAWQMTIPNLGSRRFIVDKDTAFIDYFIPLAKECGLFAVWNAKTGTISLRRIRIPSGGGAGVLLVTAYTFDESNRGKREDMTEEEEDRESMRTGWTVKTGWSATQDKFTGPTFKIDNYFPTIMYGIQAHTEEIADKSLLPTTSLGKMLGSLIGSRSVFFNTPWTRLKRAADKRYSLATPGDVVGPIVDRNATAPGGANGITSADAVYGLLMAVSFNPKGLDDGKVEILINPDIDPARTKPLSPSALIDFTKNDAGYTNGWNAATKNLWLKREYSNDADATTYDGISFPVGRKIRITQLDLMGPPTVEHDTVAAVSASGQVVTLTTGFAAVSPTVESVMLCESFGAADAAALGSVAYQGDAQGSAVGASVTLAFLWV